MIIVTEASQTALAQAKKYNLRLTSGYRTPEHNASIGGSKTSAHTKGLAYDFAGSYASMSAFADWAHGSGMFTQVIFKDKDYATGRYIGGHQDHVHIAWSATGQVPQAGGDDLETSVSNGDSGYFVKTFQLILKNLGFYKGEVDGHFGSITEDATKNFQESRDLEADGIAGHDTLNKAFGTTATTFFIRLP